MSGRRFTLSLALVMAGLLAAAYGNGFGVGFIFDDSYGIAQNPAIQSLANVARFFTDPFLLTPIRENVDVRPVLMVTFAVNYAISGLAPWSWHLFNVLLHFGASMAVFLIVRDHLWWPREERGPEGTARWPAAAAALFFALAPLNQQPVVYMWARSALLCTALGLFAFLAFLEERRWLAASLFGLALLTKAIAAALPLVIVVWLVIERRKIVRELWPMLAVLAPYLVYRMLLLPDWSEAARHEAWVTRTIWLMTGWTSYLEYVRHFLWPDALSVDHESVYNLRFFTARTLLSLAGVLAWLGVALACIRRAPAVTMGTAWYFLALAPETTVSPISEVINDHRPYSGSPGLALLLAWGLWTLARRFSRRPGAALAAVSLAACVAAVPVIRQRNWIWQDPLRLWLDAEEKGPGNGRAAMNAGRELMARGRLAEAGQRFDRARTLMPANPYLYMNRSVLQGALGNRAKAVEEARRAVELAPGNALARKYYDDALRAGDGSAEMLMQRGLDALYQRGDARAADGFFGQVLEKNPEHYGATYQRAVALEKLGRKDEARALWTKVAAMAAQFRDQATAKTAEEHLRAETR